VSSSCGETSHERETSRTGRGPHRTLDRARASGQRNLFGVKIIPVRINAYEFRDFIQEECRFAATRNLDEEIYKRIFAKAKELHLPLEKKNLKLDRTMHEMVISAKYQQTIDLKVTKYVFKFDHEERAPLF
jgi:hypothetical protein